MRFFCPTVFFRDIRVVVQTQSLFRQRRRQSNRMQITQATTTTKVSTLSRHSAQLSSARHIFFITINFSFFLRSTQSITHIHILGFHLCVHNVLRAKKSFR
uniref:(northern house mosquito) hypothetical protein n=1 Tax=Culex pipiens TaxID=7175 RepID=A0A8D8B2T8_CULPI